jgi:hypothetical protein
MAQFYMQISTCDCDSCSKYGDEKKISESGNTISEHSPPSPSFPNHTVSCTPLPILPPVYISVLIHFISMLAELDVDIKMYPYEMRIGGY